jgi:hypothetical protein
MVGVVSAVLSCLCTGCIWTLREGRSISTWPLATERSETSISIAVSAYSDESDANPVASDLWRKQTLRAYEDSGLFREVKSAYGMGTIGSLTWRLGPADTDMWAKVEVRSESTSNDALFALHLVTFFLLPFRDTDVITTKTTLKDGNGKTLGTFTESERLTNWAQLLLLPMAPLEQPPSVRQRVVYDLNHASLIEAHARGILPK